MSFLSKITEFRETHKEIIQKMFIGTATVLFLCVELHLPWISTDEDVRRVAEVLAIGLLVTCVVEIVGTIHSIELLGSKFQSERIRLRLSGLAAEKLKSRRGKLKIHLSKIPYTVRAAQFGEEFVILGWYSYGKIEVPRSGYSDDRSTCTVITCMGS